MRTLACLALLAATPAGAQDLFFQSPSGNIGCIMFETGGVRCDMASGTPSYARPSDCDLDFGLAFYVGPTGRGEPICHGDTALEPRADVLSYGFEVEFGGVLCDSAETGVTCVNRQGGGFTIRRARQEVF